MDLSSDHSPTIVTVLCSSISCLAPIATRLNWLKFRKYLSTHCSENLPLRTPTEVDQSIEKLEENLMLAGQHAALPHRQTRFNIIHSADVEQLLAEKRRTRREWQRHRSPRLKNELKECTRKLKNLLDSKKTASLTEYLESLDTTADSGYSLWRAARNLKRPVMSRPPLRKPNGDWGRNDIEKGKLFVDHLKQVFTPNTANGYVELPPQVSLSSTATSLRFEMRDIERVIKDLNVKKAPGIDKISNKMIMEMPRSAKRLLLFIFNAVLRLEYFPLAWKISLISLIPKPGKDHTRAESYRPISLLSNISKLFEKALIKKLHLLVLPSEGECIPNHQFEFRSKHSTIEQTHRLVRRTFEKVLFHSSYRRFSDI